MGEPEHIEFIVPDKGSMDIASMAFIEAIRHTTPAKAVELAIVAYHWSEQTKVVNQFMTEYPSLNDLRSFLEQYVVWRDSRAEGS